MAFARDVEARGYHTLVMPDHFGARFALAPALVLAAEATSRLRVGSLVYDNDFRHPAAPGSQLWAYGRPLAWSVVDVRTVKRRTGAPRKNRAPLAKAGAPKLGSSSTAWTGARPNWLVLASPLAGCDTRYQEVSNGFTSRG